MLKCVRYSIYIEVEEMLTKRVVASSIALDAAQSSLFPDDKDDYDDEITCIFVKNSIAVHALEIIEGVCELKYLFFKFIEWSWVVEAIFQNFSMVLNLLISNVSMRALFTGVKEMLNRRIEDENTTSTFDNGFAENNADSAQQ